MPEHEAHGQSGGISNPGTITTNGGHVVGGNLTFNQQGPSADDIVDALEKRGVLQTAETGGLQRRMVVMLAQRLKPAERLDFEQAITELERAVEIALDVTARGERGGNEDTFVNTVLAEVAEKTRNNDLDGGAQAIADALAEIDRRETAQRETAQRERITLFDAGIKQHTLRRDAVAIARLIEQCIATQHAIERPAWHPEFRARYDEYQADGDAKGINFSLEVAIECARRMLSTARNPDERGAAAVLLGIALSSLESIQPCGDLFPVDYVFASRDEDELVAKVIWRVKLVAELAAGVTREVEVARLERDEQVGLADLGLQLAEAKQLTAALQAEMVSTQVSVMGERCRWCGTCGRMLTSKGYYPATLRSLFGDVPVQVRRLLVCPCQSAERIKSFAVLDLAAATVAPELAYVTARYAALLPFGKAASLLTELLPIGGAVNAGTVRNRTMRVGQDVVPPHPIPMEPPNAPQPAEAIVVGLDGGYVRNRHRQEARHFEVIAGRVFNADGNQSRFAFVRNGPTRAADAFKQALAVAGVEADMPATVLCDGDAGLWRLQREALPGATMVLDWWHAAVRFEHGLQAARGLGAGTTDTSAADAAVHGLERAKWRLWHGRWPGCRRKLAALCRWTQRPLLRDVAGIGRLQQHLSALLGYLERNQDALVHYAARRQRGGKRCGGDRSGFDLTIGPDGEPAATWLGLGLRRMGWGCSSMAATCVVRSAWFVLRRPVPAHR